MNIAIVISILGGVIAVSSFVLNRKDKATSDIGSEQYKMGVLENKVDNISKQLDKVLDKLEHYENEIDMRIGEALKHHVKEYHK